ncbi:MULTISPECIES: zinc-binding dehydrogenase [unclassified Cupriavidus]|uniref:zinc-binding dehydrogenase n=2 Tax=unclassified Cupriavidus TaxID=2640874 RepID=UPI000687AAFD|nr:MULTISPECIES: zinc-binding dehydrogenase [unclassified Cupriavidus]MBP0632721.1 zinc-binding dehydrogenase [Cupriavidus sp. AcVe19-1a]
MKAAMIISGPQGGHVEIREIPRPTPGPGQVVVQVMASGLNRGELVRVGEAKSGGPILAGIEFAGIVSQVGPDVRGVREGDRVTGHGWGGQSEYVLAEARALIPIPATLSWVEAAAFPNVFISTHDALVTNGEFRAGQSVLVNAATGGMGLAAVQLAAQLGASQVIATSRSAAKLARLREYGATHTIDTSQQDTVQAVKDITDGRGVDVIIDSLGGAVFDTNLKCLAVRGRLVIIARMSGVDTAQVDIKHMWVNRLKVVGTTFRTRTEEERLALIEACARDVLPLLREGRLKMPVDRLFALDDIAQAHAYMATNQHFGKIIVAVHKSVMAAAVPITVSQTATKELA